MTLKNIIHAGLIAAVIVTPARAADADRLTPDEQRLRSAAEQCSEAALVRYALSSIEPAEKVADAAFYMCKDLWGEFAATWGRRNDAGDLLKEALKNCRKLRGDSDPSCRIVLGGSQSAMGKVAREEFINRASREVFEIRAEAIQRSKPKPAPLPAPTRKEI
jgi:hypothetical protein